MTIPKIDGCNGGVCSGTYHRNVITVIVNPCFSLRARNHPLVPFCWSLLCVVQRSLLQSSFASAGPSSAFSYHYSKLRKRWPRFSLQLLLLMPRPSAQKKNARNAATASNRGKTAGRPMELQTKLRNGHWVLIPFGKFMDPAAM